MKWGIKVCKNCGSNKFNGACPVCDSVPSEYSLTKIKPKEEDLSSLTWKGQNKTGD